MAETSLEKLERQYEQAKARLQAARARKATKDRKLEARRKIILGGALIERAGRDTEAARLMKALVTGLSRAQDRKALENWTPPAPPVPPASEGTPDGAGPYSGNASGENAAAPAPGAAGKTGVPDSEADVPVARDKGGPVETPS